MKTTFRRDHAILLMVCVALFLSCKKKSQGAFTPSPPIVDTSAPPKTWQEHWFEHIQLVQRAFYDSSVAIYFDNDVNKSITWPNTYLAATWNYTKTTYGRFGTDSRLYAIFHAGKYSGGHPSTYFDASHDYRNMIDVGSSSLSAWASGTGNDLDLVTHEIGHIVEGASNNVHNSPAFAIWKDSKWMEIYIYDVYKGLGRDEDAQRWYAIVDNAIDDFPRAGTHWFRDWFYPIYHQYGGTSVLKKFFGLLAVYFPKSGNAYSRDMNWGEFVHFWSGAAGINLKTQATTAFGWPAEWESQFNEARANFPAITY